ncbi:hypothetical protein ACWD3K_34360 [Streptomyces sp. NPDC002778]
MVTQAATKRVVDTYERVNNRANKAQDEELLHTVEGGQVHEQSKADYATLKTWPKDEQKAYRTAFFYQERTYFIPRRGEATWFAVKAKSSYGKRPTTLMIFDRVGGTYKMVMSLYTGNEVSIPRLAVDADGFAQVADPTKPVGSLAPDDLTAAVQDLYISGGVNEGKKLAPSEPKEQAVTAHHNSEKNGAADGMATLQFFAEAPAHPRVYALRTADGGVLAAFPAAHKREALLKPQYRSSHHLVPDERETTLGASQGAVITDEIQGQGLAVMSTTGARVLEMDLLHVDSR